MSEFFQNYLSPEDYSKALSLAKGCYQRGLLRGYYRLSGADLKGNASRYSGHYANSRDAVLARLRRAGIAYTEARGSHNKRILILGEVPNA